MMTQQFHPSTLSLPPHQGSAAELDGLRIAYDGQTRMRLTIASGMAGARVHIDPEATELIAIDCGEGAPPRLQLSESELRVSWPWQGTFASWLRSLAGERHDVEIALHPAVEWTLRIRGGLSRFEADLAHGHLAGLEISGGVSQARLDLPPPGSVVPIHVSGGASRLALHRPENAGVALAVGGGVSGLRLDDQGFDALGGHVRLAAGRVQGDIPHYAVEISGGASDLRIVPA
jgi:hypothetical protein